MSGDAYATRDLVIRDQTLIRADIEPAAEDVGQPAVAWGVGIVAAPPGTETPTPYALASMMIVRCSGSTFRAQHLVTIAASREPSEDSAALDALWDECLRRFGRVLWRTGLVVIRQLAAIAEVDLSDIANMSIQPERTTFAADDPAEANPAADDAN